MKSLPKCLLKDLLKGPTKGLIAFLIEAMVAVDAHAQTECLSFIKDWQGQTKAVFDRQIITETEKELVSYDGISVKVLPERSDFSKISVYLINDGRRQLMVGETVWLSAEILSRSNTAYWVLIDCAPDAERKMLFHP